MTNEDLGVFDSQAVGFVIWTGNPAEFTTLINDDALIDVAMPVKISNRHLGWARVEMTRRSSNANLNLLGLT